MEIAERWIAEMKPRIVVDFGTGLGAYGKVCRKLSVPCVGVEVWPDFVTKSILHYDFMIHEDMRSFIDKVWGGLFIFGNCLEHMKKEQGLRTVLKAKERASNIIISTPYGYVPYAGVPGKPNSPHVCGYTPESFKSFLNVKEVALIYQGSVKKPGQFMVLAGGDHS